MVSAYLDCHIPSTNTLDCHPGHRDQQCVDQHVPAAVQNHHRNRTEADGCKKVPPVPNKIRLGLQKNTKCQRGMWHAKETCMKRDMWHDKEACRMPKGHDMCHAKEACGMPKKYDMRHVARGKRHATCSTL
jgi:hypothetical protein